MPQIGFGHQCMRDSAPQDAAALDDGVPVTNACEMLDILVDHPDGLAARHLSRSGAGPSCFIQDHPRKMMHPISNRGRRANNGAAGFCFP
jgi:hypothetical protein